MRKVDFLKNTLICGVLSSNLLNCNAMEYIDDINKNKEKLEYNNNYNKKHNIDVTEKEIKNEHLYLTTYLYKIDCEKISKLISA